VPWLLTVVTDNRGGARANVLHLKPELTQLQGCARDWKSCARHAPFLDRPEPQLDPLTGNVSAHEGVPRGGLTSDQSVEAAKESSPRRCCSFCRVSEGLPSHTG
jgi:hypothetical protein